jgi:hypothetical protein
VWFLPLGIAPVAVAVGAFLIVDWAPATLLLLALGLLVGAWWSVWPPPFAQPAWDRDRLASGRDVLPVDKLAVGIALALAAALFALFLVVAAVLLAARVG